MLGYWFVCALPAARADDAPFSDDEVPHGDGDEVADDSIFENDPFFQLPDQGEDSDGAEQESKGMFKKRKDKKGDDKAARKKEAEEEEKLRKATEREQLKLLMMMVELNILG